MYDALAGSAGLGATEFLGAQRTLQCLPTVRPEGLKGGSNTGMVSLTMRAWHWRLARTAALHGALLVNYCAARTLVHEQDKVSGLQCEDTETGQTFHIRARCVVNATGVWVDALRQQDSEAIHRPVRPIVAPSQGVHVVVDQEFLPSDHALMVPKTADGRVLFAVPWLGKVILGTTDSPRNDLDREPAPFAQELRFILGESARYLRRAPEAQDIRSIWVGLRPLVKPQDDDGNNTKSLSREHTVLVSRSGLVTVTGGKWTTYRAMAEDVLDKCFEKGLLPGRPAGGTLRLPLVSLPKLTTPERSARIAGSFGLRASNRSATRGRPPVMSRVLAPSVGMRAMTSPGFTSSPSPTDRTAPTGSR